MRYLFLTLIFIFSLLMASGQQTLPGFSVNDVGGKIIVSWKNEYQIKATTVSIQRSYDSTKNFTSIGSVLNPESKENGFADTDPPYNRMYYRLFVAFEGGAYILTGSQRPTKDLSTLQDTSETVYPWQVNPFSDETINVPPENPNTYPSSRMYSFRESSIVIDLPDAALRKYRIVVYDESNKQIFELTNLKEAMLILDKVNFPHSGWYHFEIFDGGTLVEKNRFNVPQDKKRR